MRYEVSMKFGQYGKYHVRDTTTDSFICICDTCEDAEYIVKAMNSFHKRIKEVPNDKRN